MKKIDIYEFKELSASAKMEADKGAFIYASQVLLSSAEKMPANATNAMFSTARKEWLDGWFHKSGTMRLPAQMLKDEAGETEEEKANGVIGGLREL